MDVTRYDQVYRYVYSLVDVAERAIRTLTLAERRDGLVDEEYRAHAVRCTFEVGDEICPVRLVVDSINCDGIVDAVVPRAEMFR
jgi:hypothetical protein